MNVKSMIRNAFCAVLAVACSAPTSDMGGIRNEQALTFAPDPPPAPSANVTIDSTEESVDRNGKLVIRVQGSFADVSKSAGIDVRFYDDDNNQLGMVVYISAGAGGGHYDVKSPRPLDPRRNYLVVARVYGFLGFESPTVAKRVINDAVANEVSGGQFCEMGGGLSSYPAGGSFIARRTAVLHGLHAGDTYSTRIEKDVDGSRVVVDQYVADTATADGDLFTDWGTFEISEEGTFHFTIQINGTDVQEVTTTVFAR